MPVVFYAVSTEAGLVPLSSSQSWKVSKFDKEARLKITAQMTDFHQRTITCVAHRPGHKDMMTTSTLVVFPDFARSKLSTSDNGQMQTQRSAETIPWFRQTKAASVKPLTNEASTQTRFVASSSGAESSGSIRHTKGLPLLYSSFSISDKLSPQPPPSTSQTPGEEIHLQRSTGEIPGHSSLHQPTLASEARLSATLNTELRVTGIAQSSSLGKEQSSTLLPSPTGVRTSDETQMKSHAHRQKRQAPANHTPVSKSTPSNTVPSFRPPSATIASGESHTHSK